MILWTATHVSVSEALAGRKGTSSGDLDVLSTVVEEVKLQVASHLIEDAPLYIGGTGALAILDAAYTNKLPIPRDLDLYVAANPIVTKGIIEGFKNKLTQEPGRLGVPDSLTFPKPRGDPNATGRVRNLGHGFDIHDSSRPFIVDLSVFNTEDSAHDLGLNGILNIDQVYIPTQERTVLEIVEQLRDVRYATALERGLVRDPHGGYRAWRMRRGIRVAQWAEIERDPLLQSVRVIRSYAKAGYLRLPPEVAQRLRELIRGAETPNRSKLTDQENHIWNKCLNNVMDLDNRRAALQMLSDVGFFDKASSVVPARLSGADLHVRPRAYVRRGAGLAAAAARPTNLRTFRGQSRHR